MDIRLRIFPMNYECKVFCHEERPMKILSLIILILTLGSLTVVVSVEGASGSPLASHKAHFLGIGFAFGFIQRSLLSAGEPIQLMLIGIGLIALAIHLRRRTVVDEGNSGLDSTPGGPA